MQVAPHSVDHRKVTINQVLKAAAAAELPDSITANLLAELEKSLALVPMIQCACGDEFEVDSFGGGFLSATGCCFGCDAEAECKK